MTSSSGVSFSAAANEGGGAALDQVIGMSVVAAMVTVGLLWIGYLHRTRRITWLNNLADSGGTQVQAAAVGGAAARACSPRPSSARCSASSGTSACTSARAATPGRWPTRRTTSSWSDCSCCSSRACWRWCCRYDKPGPAAVRITRTWYAPVGGVLMAGCGLYALIGFPLDDIWHRIFGQDVTLWGPTHLMLIGGAGLSLIAVLLLEYEGRTATRPDAPTPDNRLSEVPALPVRSAACSSGCRSSRSNTTSASSSSGWCCSR